MGFHNAWFTNAWLQLSILICLNLLVTSLNAPALYLTTKKKRIRSDGSYRYNAHFNEAVECITQWHPGTR
jgi:hypothetical protein